MSVFPILVWISKMMFKPLYLNLVIVLKQFLCENNSTKEFLNYACITGNVALGKNTNSGAAYSYGGVTYDPGRAVDGNTNPNFFNGSCFHHDSTSGTAWWMVDLGVPHVIYNVTIYNRRNFGTCSVLGSLNGHILSFLELILPFVCSLL